MMSLSGMPSASSIFQAYASMSASITIFKTMLNQMVPHQVQQYIVFKIRSYFRPNSSDDVTLVIDERDGMGINEVYNAAETYLSTRISPEIQRFKISKRPKDTNVNVKFGNCGKISDSFEGIELVWKFVQEPGKNTISRFRDGDGDGGGSCEKRYFELSFYKEHKDKILNCYIPLVINKAKDVCNNKKVVKLHALNSSHSYNPSTWDSVNLEHPSTFDTIALEPSLKKTIIEDLDRFLKRKEFYRRVGKAWKRGYLLYGPPGTGKSSLIAAIANYLKFDIYDLEFSNIKRDSDLRRLLLSTKNRSILVIEDIDCGVELPDRTENGTIYSTNDRSRDSELTLSGLLNFIDGLWSSCGDERVIIFTTNHKERLDPALLRPGRMDMHIHMSYLTSESFKVLATNYLEISDPNYRGFKEVQELIEGVQITPAEVAEQFMKSEDPDVCIEGLVKFLKRKRISNNEESEETRDDNTTHDAAQLPQMTVECP
ncbi:AAA-ATPase At5g17760-like [Lycium ferocissimum]|uniref:AAA-ATPase At5g17760-like n=1 Tax=Lycium ferocissimum TaxID=112874 RepID=UPI002815BF89|nr:AAA-ATPase At5g17760-like [Lycium ferocissimum]